MLNDFSFITDNGTTFSLIYPDKVRCAALSSSVRWIDGLSVVANQSFFQITFPGPFEPGNCQPIWVTVLITQHARSAACL